jgi:hypothetical protein
MTELGNRILQEQAELIRLGTELASEVRLAEARRDAAVSQQVPDLVSAQWIAAHICMSERAVYDLMDRGAFGQLRRIGNRRLVMADGYIHFLETEAT